MPSRPFHMLHLHHWWKWLDTAMQKATTWNMTATAVEETPGSLDCHFTMLCCSAEGRKVSHRIPSDFQTAAILLIYRSVSNSQIAQPMCRVLPHGYASLFGKMFQRHPHVEATVKNTHTHSSNTKLPRTHSFQDDA